MRRCGLLALSALALVFVPAAAAANPVPNPGFEAYCDPPGAPCKWTGGQRDEQDPHAGLASVRTFFNELTIIDRVLSECAPASISPGLQTLSLWYRTADTRTLSVYASVQFFSDGGCSSPLGSDDFSQAANYNGAWHHASGTVQIPANVQGVAFHLGGTAQVYPGDPPAPINFDDVSLGAPTSVTVTRFWVQRRRGGVQLSWRSFSEAGIVGYELLRTAQRAKTRPVSGLVPAAGRSGAYTVMDRTARSATAYTYILRSVGPDGSRRTLRTVRLAA